MSESAIDPDIGLVSKLTDVSSLSTTRKESMSPSYPMAASMSNASPSTQSIGSAVSTVSLGSVSVAVFTPSPIACKR